MSKIVVVGSINVDLTVTSDRFPKVGESLVGNNFETFFGGKGANQAVACSRLGAEVTMVGCVGSDANGNSVLQNFKKEGICTDYIRTVDRPTGVALITVAENDNEIIVVKGANDCVSKELVDQAEKAILEADMVLCQLEIPLETVEYTVHLCKEKGIPVLLNPAPFTTLPESILEEVSYITPNEVEVQQLSAVPFVETIEKYQGRLIMTCGSKGVYYYDGEKVVNAKANLCKVVDTTGAGDTFNGALAVGLCEKMELKDAICFAQKASSIAIGKMGAQTAMPTREEM